MRPILLTYFLLTIILFSSFYIYFQTVYSAAYDYSFVGSLGSVGKAIGRFNHPADVALDESNKVIYVADINNYRIQKFSDTGIFISSWGSKGQGNGEFDKPGDVAIDDLAVYVSDIKNNRIQKFASDGKFIASWGSTGSAKGQFEHPGAIAIDSESKILYVVDVHNSRVQKFTTDGEFVSTWGSLGHADGLLYGPAGLTYDAPTKRVYVADSGNDRIQAFDKDGKFLFAWGDRGTGNGQFLRLTDIATDSDKNLILVTDSDNERIQAFDKDGNFLLAWGSKGRGNEQFLEPTGVAINSRANLVYVVDKLGGKISIFRVTLPATSGESKNNDAVITENLTGRTDNVKYSNPVMSITMLYPQGWKYSETQNKLTTTFGPTIGDSDSVTLQIKAVKIPASNFSLASYLSRYLELLEKSPLTSSINETQNISMLGNQAYELLYNKQINNNSFSVMQDFTSFGRMLYVLTYNAPTEQFYNYLPMVREITKSISLISDDKNETILSTPASPSIGQSSPPNLTLEPLTQIPSSSNQFSAKLSGANEVPPVDSDASGTASFSVNENKISFKIEVSGIAKVWSAHLHNAEAGSNGDIVAVLFESEPTDEIDGVLTEASFTSTDLTGPLKGKTISHLVDLMKKGTIYVNVHSDYFPDGEIRGTLVSSTPIPKKIESSKLDEVSNYKVHVLVHNAEKHMGSLNICAFDGSVQISNCVDVNIGNLADSLDKPAFEVALLDVKTKKNILDEYSNVSVCFDPLSSQRSSWGGCWDIQEKPNGELYTDYDVTGLK